MGGTARSLGSKVKKCNVYYVLNQHWKVAGMVRYEKIRFAVDGDESVGELGEDRSIPLPSRF